MTCAACLARGKTWEGSDPVCAFEGGQYATPNWNCATVGMIRDIAYEGQHPMPRGVSYQYCEDQKYATIRCDEISLPYGDELALWLTWYKSRGGTDQMVLLGADGFRAPTEAECLTIAAHYTSAALAAATESKESS